MLDLLRIQPQHQPIVHVLKSTVGAEVENVR